MSVLYDESHKRIDTSELKSKRRKKLNVTLGSIALSLTLLSGCGKSDILNNEKEEDNVNSNGVSDTFDLLDEVEVDDKVVDDAIEKDYEAFSRDNKIEVVEHESSELLVLPSCFESISCTDNVVRFKAGDTVTYDDLKMIKYVFISIDEDTDLSILNYMPNLESLSIHQNDSNCKISGIDGARLPNGISISLWPKNGLTIKDAFPIENYLFLKDVESISKLEIGYYDLSSLDLDNLNVDTLKFSITECSNIPNFNFKGIKKLIIDGEKYCIPMYINRTDIESLEQQSIEVEITNCGKDIKNEVLEISDKIDSIYDSLGINADGSEIDKLDKILHYVIDTCEYDSDVASAISAGENEQRIIREKGLCNDGILFGALEKDTQICVNYSAITKALCKRAGLSCFCLSSKMHAWNGVKIGDYYYYVDATWLDGSSVENRVEKGNVITISYIPASLIFDENNSELKSKLQWYLEDPTEIENIDSNNNHVLSISVSGMDIVDIPDDVRNEVLGITIEEVYDEKIDDINAMFTTKPNSSHTGEEEITDISNKKFKITINGKTAIISGAVLIGILSGLGMGALIHKNKVRNDALRKKIISSKYNNDNSTLPNSHYFKR